MGVGHAGAIVANAEDLYQVGAWSKGRHIGEGTKRGSDGWLNEAQDYRLN